MSNGRDTLKQDRGRISHFFSEMKAKFKNPGFQKDLSVYGGIASLIPIGRAFSVGKNFVGGFMNTSNQYRKIASKGLPKSMQAMFEAPTQYARAFAPQATNTARVVAKKNKDLANKIMNNKHLNQQTTRNIKPIHRDGKVYDREAINKAFSDYFNR